ncbi:MAG: GntR family transcriptional regulator [Paracoccus sp. (in: a-proteobacteria)]|uniref:GntR family transcriptional regulator n=1 Tax=unclassified Paracoccus (in: a-proteobacteria) TaxID=2688777 RepID=UPI000C51C34A|nr:MULTISPECIES: GntR family transcriptional regulator [unclassified Paracoccus (in: a-proteobacteria)]MAN55143.1 GntR family transcriptional regulator [Paracoccus sp. (in: a-proteobacteria)]MBA47981.1 GntR family transcriptional regulator [Paracoccus sp. (in: a-proteobacteria)]MCS5600593.1 GntR family transcriptional regulator [Paracoccus sp. (in: a-proteobacteria)]HIC64691.1 GntR family transcriptional regulator [Paracoccus sp. (in: a-proteobacteria)]
MRRTLQGEGVYDRLCEQIRSGTIRPGARLTETELAARLGVSRTPVREAIRRLEADGLVDHQPRSGAVVRQLAYPEIMELYEMRTVLEGTAARLSARAASPMELEALRSINAEMARAVEDAARLVRLNRQFHARLLDAARNRFLLRAAASVENTLLILGPSAMAAPERARQAVEEHEAVLDALAARDGQRAEAAMREHMERAQLTRLRILRQKDEAERD